MHPFLPFIQILTFSNISSCRYFHGLPYPPPWSYLLETPCEITADFCISPSGEIRHKAKPEDSGSCCSGRSIGAVWFQRRCVCAWRRVVSRFPHCSMTCLLGHQSQVWSVWKHEPLPDREGPAMASSSGGCWPCSKKSFATLREAAFERDTSFFTSPRLQEQLQSLQMPTCLL